jgi:hypothetical protein
MAENGPKTSGDLLAILAAQQAASESQIQETVNWSRETHARMPWMQSLVFTAALLLVFGGAGILVFGIWQATEGRGLWLILCTPVAVALLMPNSLLAYRIQADLRSPFGRKSPYEQQIIELLYKLFDVEEQTDQGGERVFVLRSRQKQEVSPERKREIDTSELASFVMRIPHKGTSLRAWEPELGREQYRHFRDELIAGGWADWRVYNAKGNPVLGQGWELVSGITPRQIVEEIS